MIHLYPAIDLQNGRCVRLEQGRLDAPISFNDDPANQARIFAQAGFEWLHVVDLDGAASGRSVNRAALRAILQASSAKVQIGGGIRNRETAQDWIEAGAHRIILGTAALRDPQLVQDLARDFPASIVVALDAREGRIAVQGWTEATQISVLDLARRFVDKGVCALIITDIGRDGMKTGMNLELCRDVAQAVPIPVIASGGFAGMADIERALTPQFAMLDGLILGRALYDGLVDPQAALALAAQNFTDA